MDLVDYFRNNGKLFFATLADTGGKASVPEGHGIIYDPKRKAPKINSSEAETKAYIEANLKGYFKLCKKPGCKNIAVYDLCCLHNSRARLGCGKHGQNQWR